MPGCIIVKNDPKYLQGIPDWCVIIGSDAYFFEAKAKHNAHKQPNQEYYVTKINNDGGYARFVYPENMEEILEEFSSYCGGRYEI